MEVQNRKYVLTVQCKQRLHRESRSTTFQNREKTWCLFLETQYILTINNTRKAFPLATFQVQKSVRTTQHYLQYMLYDHP